MSNNYEIIKKYSIKEFNKEQWDRCNINGNIFLSYNFLLSLEQSNSVCVDKGWSPIYFGVIKKSTLIAVIPSFIKSHSQGEFVFDHAWAQAYNNLGLQYYPKLLVASPFTPVSGLRILINPNEESKELKIKLIDYIKNYCVKKNISSIHINFFDTSELDTFKRLGFTIRYGEQFHFTNQNYKNFNDFLDRLNYKSRKKIIKERKSLINKDICIDIISKKDINKKICEYMYEFYMSTIQKKWSYNYLSKDFFLNIPKYLSKNTIIITAKYKKDIIAGALNFISNNKLYGRYWGCFVEIPNLHFEVCYYKAIEIAIKNKYYTVEAGAQGAHKIKRGYLPKITYSAHFIFNKSLKNAINNFVKEEKNTILNEVNYINENYSPYKNIN